MEDRGQQLDTNSFFVSYLGEIPDSKLSVIAYAGIRFYQWEISGERRKFAEVTFNSISEAEQAYNKHNGIVIEGQQLKFLVKRAMTTLWLSGLPSVVYNRDLFTGLQDLTPGLSHLSIPPHPEIPGISCLGIAILTYDTHSHAEDALAILKNPTRLYNQNYRVFVNRDIQVMWSEPFFDLTSALVKETRFVVVSNLPVNASIRLIEEELSCLGQIERIRLYATWAVVAMKNVSEAKALMKSTGLLVDGRKWKIHPAVRLNEDPYEPDLYRNVKNQTLKAGNVAEPVYELSVLQLSTADRQRLYEVIQGSSAFPCTRESVKGLSADLLNKARKLLQHSRRPTETTAPKDYLLTHDNKLVGSFEPIKKARYEPQRFQEPRQAPPARMPEKPAMRYPEPRFESRYTPEPRFNSDSHFPNDNNPPAYLPYTPLQTVAPSHDRNMMQPHSLTPEQMQNMTAEQKMQYFYYLNNPSTYYNQYGPY